jgi:hypothetical protein
MSHRVEIPPMIRRKIMSWSLPDEVLVEVYLRLTETLANNPASVLQRTREPSDGMVYFFELIDPQNRLCVHSFLFQIVYSQDEQSVLVARGGYRRDVGL